MHIMPRRVKTETAKNKKMKVGDIVMYRNRKHRVINISGNKATIKCTCGGREFTIDLNSII